MRARSQQGQVMLLSLALLAMSTVLLLLLFQVGFLVREKIRLQTAADLALLSALNTQANSLNALAVCNRTILAQDAFAGRLNALVSESAFIRRILEGVSWIVRLIPYAGPILGQAVRGGGEGLETICRKAAQAGVPVVAPANQFVAAQAQVIRSSLVILPVAAANRSLKVNAPAARLSPLSQAALVLQGRKLAAGMTPLAPRDAANLVESTLDPHSRRRNWKLFAGALPIRKIGGTSVDENDLHAFDRLEFKVFRWGKWKWKSIVSTQSMASQFRYRGHGVILGLDGESVPPGLTVLLTQSPESPVGWVSPPGLPMSAVSSGRLTYRREGQPQEPPNLLNPFWGSTLIPVAEEAGARKLVPSFLLKEVRH